MLIQGPFNKVFQKSVGIRMALAVLNYWPVADLEGGSPSPLFARNLPSNVDKTQDFRPKIC
jgi:hypothetical protein